MHEMWHTHENSETSPKGSLLSKYINSLIRIGLLPISRRGYTAVAGCSILVLHYHDNGSSSVDMQSGHWLSTYMRVGCILMHIHISLMRQIRPPSIMLDETISTVTLRWIEMIESAYLQLISWL